MGSLRSWRPTPSRRSTSRAASGTYSPGPSRSYVATAARSPSPSGGLEKADGQDRRGGGVNGPGAARRTDPGLPRFRAPGEPNVGHGGALRTYEIGEERAPSTPAIPGSGKVSIIPLDVPDREAHGVTPSPTPCGWSHTGPASSGSVPSAYCVTSWLSSVGYPSVIPFFLLWCWLACGAG